MIEIREMIGSAERKPQGGNMTTLYSQEEKLAQSREVPHMSCRPYKLESPVIGDDLVIGHTTGLPEGDYSWWGNRPDDWSLLAAQGGEGEIIFSNGTLPVHRGELVLISPGHPHLFRSRQWELLWVHFLMGEEQKEILSWHEALPGIFHSAPEAAEFRRVMRSLLEMRRLYLARRKNWYPLARNLLESVLIRGCSDCGGEAALPMPLWRAQERLRELSEPVDIDKLAEECGMSRAVFYLRFKEAVGLSPRRYRENYAMHCAWQLLENTDLAISEIARKVGMANIYYFSSRFRKCSGVSPSRWRNRNRKPV